MIDFKTWQELDLRVGKILEARDHPNADKLVVLKVDTGDEQRQLVAGLKGHYDTDSLVGRTVVVFTNLEPAKLRGVESRGMVLAATMEGEEGLVVSLLNCDREMPPGAKVS